MYSYVDISFFGRTKVSVCLVVTVLAMVTPTTMSQVPTPPRDLDTLCSATYFARVGSQECQNACDAAAAAGCGQRGAPRECDLYASCAILHNTLSRTTRWGSVEMTTASYVPPRHVTTKWYVPAHTYTTAAPRVGEGSRYCGVGTKMVGGKCVIAYSNLGEMCNLASQNDWGWDCKTLAQCTA